MVNKGTILIGSDTRERLKEIGRKIETYDSLIQKRTVCNAVGCDELGQLEIKVNAGKYGFVTLFVCPKCLGKFTD